MSRYTVLIRRADGSLRSAGVNAPDATGARQIALQSAPEGAVAESVVLTHNSDWPNTKP